MAFVIDKKVNHGRAGRGSVIDHERGYELFQAEGGGGGGEYFFNIKMPCGIIRRFRCRLDCKKTVHDNEKSESELVEVCTWRVSIGTTPLHGLNLAETRIILEQAFLTYRGWCGDPVDLRHEYSVSFV